MKWLITGGCGFLGTALVGSLTLEGGHKIRVVDKMSVGTRKDLAAVCEFVESEATELVSITEDSPSVELVECDVLDEELALRSAAGVDVVVHLAANTGVSPSVKDPRADLPDERSRYAKLFGSRASLWSREVRLRFNRGGSGRDRATVARESCAAPDFPVRL